MNRILVVEDEAHLAEGLRFNLEAEGYQVRVVDNAEEALDLLLAKNHSFDVLVLDVMLPAKDGFTAMTELRQAANFIPTLMLTARGQPDDILKGFAAGADDYLTKPFELAILIARVNGLLRRSRWTQGLIAASSQASRRNDVFRFGERSEKGVDFDLLELSVRDQVFRLTLMEGQVLRYLIEHEGKPVSRTSMLHELWNVSQSADTRPIDNFIVRLRRYLEDDPRSPRHVLTVRGVGYRFIADPAKK
jgi:two-component system, OmpR family, alkaline phosphatase synthesis response regulator PhoP